MMKKEPEIHIDQSILPESLSVGKKKNSQSRETSMIDDTRSKSNNFFLNHPRKNTGSSNNSSRKSIAPVSFTPFQEDNISEYARRSIFLPT